MEATTKQEYMHQPRVLLDCDGILADFHSMYLQVIYLLTNVVLKVDDITDWDILGLIGKTNQEEKIRNYIEDNKLCYNIDPLPGAIDAVAKLQQNSEVVIVTAPMNTSTWCSERLNWLKKHFSINKYKVILATSKHYISGDFFIDDNLDNCKKWSDENDGQAILWDRPWNRKNRIHMNNIAIAHNWDEVFGIISPREQHEYM